MALIALTSANIRALQANGAVVRPYNAGAEVTIGYAVYIAADGDVEHADGDVDAATAKGIGIAVESYDGETTVVAGNPVSVCVFGPVSGFTGMTPGDNLYVADTVGRLGDVAGTFSRIMGYVERAGVFFVHPEQNDPAS